MRIATYNVNGVNGRLPVLLRWLEEAAPAVVCLQELKAPQDKFPEAAIREAGYGAIWKGEKSWNGVAILVRGEDPVETQRGLPGDPEDAQSRYLEAAVGGLIIWLPLSPERQSRTGPKVRLQAAVGRPPLEAGAGPSRDRRSCRVGRRLQRHADGVGRLQAGALGRRRAIPAGGARSLCSPGLARLDGCVAVASPGRAHLHL